MKYFDIMFALKCVFKLKLNIIYLCVYEQFELFEYIYVRFYVH